MRTLVKTAKKLGAMALLLLLLVSIAVPAFAAEGATVKAHIDVSKTVTGDYLPAAETFTFELKAVDKAPMPADAKDEKATATITTRNTGSAAFGDVTYSDVGYYKYTVRELTGTNRRITYDDTVYDATVLVTWKDGIVNGTLETTIYFQKQGDAQGKKQNDALFSNRYSAPYDPPGPTPVEVDPPVRKAVTGKPSTVANSTFTFVMKADKISYPMPSGSVNGTKTMTVVGEGEVEFGNIRYASAGTYTYTIYEQAGSDSYRYDKTVYNMTVVVTERNSRLEATRSIRYANGAATNEALFTNKYLKGPATGDTTNIALYVVLGMISAIGLAVLLMYVKKEKKENP